MPMTWICSAVRITTFLKTTDRPTLIVVDSHIGYGSPHKQDSSRPHGEPLGEAEVKLVKRIYGWPEDAKFLVPDGVYDHFKNGIGKRGAEARAAWNAKFDDYKKQIPRLGRSAAAYSEFSVAGWVGQGPADFPRGCQRNGDPRIFRQSAERTGARIFRGCWAVPRIWRIPTRRI